MADGGRTNEVHLFQGDVVATPTEIGVAALELEQHRLRKTSKHLSLRFFHFSDFHHRPTDIPTELHDPTLENVDPTPSHF